MFLGKKEYDLLNKMLDDAIAGEFSEECFDETQLSKLQSKLMRYLTNASMSEKKINEEKDNLKELITNISHQTKTPLTNILMYSELLKEQLQGEKSGEYAEEIYMQGKKLEMLIEALVKMSRLETGIFQFEKSEVLLSDIVLAVVEQGKPKATKKNIEILVGDLENVSVNIDKKWVTEAVYNVLDNAIKYSDSENPGQIDEGNKIIQNESGRNSGAYEDLVHQEKSQKKKITISIFSYELFSGIRIADQGIGMSEEEIPRAFSRFYRGKAVHDKEGIGVGLFLSREIVEGHGGYIKVNSAIGKGSTFDICFPNISTL